MVPTSFLKYLILNRSMFLHFWVKTWRKCSLHEKIHYSKANKAIDAVLAENLDYDIIFHKYGKINYILFRKLSKFTVLCLILTKNRVKKWEIEPLTDFLWWLSIENFLKSHSFHFISFIEKYHQLLQI